MTSCSSGALHQAGLAFDSIAEQYDDIFTRSLIGRAQRDAEADVDDGGAEDVGEGFDAVGDESEGMADEAGEALG